MKNKHTMLPKKGKGGYRYVRNNNNVFSNMFCS